jgi:methylase of polypeptide subunit release factors
MESLRSTKEAVMSIGYDSLELMSLVGGRQSIDGGKLLDVCCGSGIQGIWEVLVTASQGYLYSHVVMIDLNLRACKYTCAQVTINAFPSIPVVEVRQGDLYAPLTISGRQTVYFTKILSNPPFVAFPSETSQQSALLYVGA